MNELIIRDFSMMVSLGCEAPERATRQEVRVTVRIRRDAMPAGCTSDRLEDADCYGNVCDALKAVGSSREYHLIESMAYEMFQSVLKVLAPFAKVQIRVHKLHPPIEGLIGGSEFVCGDF